MTNYRTFPVPVRGGNLAVGVWGPENAPTILAIHGITASHRSWEELAKAAPDLRIIAPDLRGRARSNTLPGPWGMSTHAEDVATVLDAAGVERCVVVGHSMGAFVAASLAFRYENRVDELLLIDGGLPLPAPEGIAPPDLPEALIGPAAQRLSMQFESLETYRDFWRLHPAFASDWSESVERYVDYDLDGNAPNLTPSAVIEAITQDSLQLAGDTGYFDSLAALPMPVHFVRAPRDLMNELPGLYSEETVTQWVRRMPQLLTHEVEGVNHYTIVMAERGATAVATLVHEALDRVESTVQNHNM
jgi:pimeloyl-ACP methyl ester carboxylesterase